MQPRRQMRKVKAGIVYRVGQRISSHMDSRSAWVSLECLPERHQQELLETKTHPVSAGCDVTPCDDAGDDQCEVFLWQSARSVFLTLCSGLCKWRVVKLTLHGTSCSTTCKRTKREEKCLLDDIMRTLTREICCSAAIKHTCLCPLLML